MGVMDTRVLLSQPPSVRPHLLPAIIRAGWILEGGGCKQGPSFPPSPSARLPHAEARLSDAPVSPAALSHSSLRTPREP